MFAAYITDIRVLLGGIYLIKFVAMLIELVEFKPRKNVKFFYTV